MCPDCGIPVSPDAPNCPRCNIRIPRDAAAAAPADAGVPGVRMDASDLDDPAAGDDNGLQYQAPGGPASGITIRRDAPVAGTQRPDRQREAHDPEDVPSAAGATKPPGPSIRREQTAQKSSAGRRPPPAPPAKKPSVTSFRSSSRWATAGLISALLSFLPIFPPLAILFGGLGVREINQTRGAMAGRGRAVFALIAGSAGTLAWVGLVAWLATADFSVLKNFWAKTQLAINVAALEQLPQAQEVFRSGRYADKDGDGKGEYGTSQQLAAAMDDFDLSALEEGALGWKLTVVVPRGVNSRERAWWAFMEPVGDTTQRTWLYIDESQILRRGDGVKRKPSRRLAKTWPATSAEMFLDELFGEG